MPKRPLPLIDDGVAHAVVHDMRSAARAHAVSTGHALTPGGAPDGPIPTNLVLHGGGAASLEELCAPIERGIYVTRLWYVNTVEPREAVLTGMTRDGTFLIEDGRIGRPLRDVRFTDSALRILAATEELTARPATRRRGRPLRPALRDGGALPGPARRRLPRQRLSLSRPRGV